MNFFFCTRLHISLLSSISMCALSSTKASVRVVNDLSGCVAPLPWKPMHCWTLSPPVHRSQGPHRHREAQPDEHGQAEHQGPDRVGAKPGPNAGLRLRPAPAVLCGDGTLPQTWTEKYVEQENRFRFYFVLLLCFPSLICLIWNGVFMEVTVS